jgi:hypothetical protein
MEEHRPVTEELLVGRQIVAVDLDRVPDGYAELTLDDGSTLQIRTSGIGHLILSSQEARSG